MATDSNIIFPPNSTSNPGFARHSTLITPKDLREDYLYGISLINPITSEDISDDVLSKRIERAISQLEHELNLTITPTRYVENKDYNISDYMNYSFIQLYHKPIIYARGDGSVTFTVQYIRDTAAITFPDAWFRVYTESGQLHVTPTSGAFTNFNLNNSGMLPNIYGVRREFPQLLTISYLAGFEQDKIPHIINEAIGLTVAIPLLTTAGNLVFGGKPLYQSMVVLDGATQQEIGAGGQGKSPYHAQIVEYKKQLDTAIKTIKNYYNGVNFVAS